MKKSKVLIILLGTEFLRLQRRQLPSSIDSTKHFLKFSMMPILEKNGKLSAAKSLRVHLNNSRI
jgi:hypothetical protein